MEVKIIATSFTSIVHKRAAAKIARSFGLPAPVLRDAVWVSELAMDEQICHGIAHSVVNHDMGNGVFVDVAVTTGLR